jgi:hypothetical protein
VARPHQRATEKVAVIRDIPPERRFGGLYLHVLLPSNPALVFLADIVQRDLVLKQRGRQILAVFLEVLLELLDLLVNLFGRDRNLLAGQEKHQKLGVD